MYKGKKIIAIIPARKGSKGLVDKNIKELNEKPLIAYTIEAAKESKCFDSIIVSTDSEKYAQISKKYGAEVPFLRSEKNSSDTAGSWEVCNEVLGKLDKKYDILVLLQPTSPLRNSQHIKEALDLFFEKNANIIVSVTKMSHPIQWCNYLPDNLSLNNFVKEENKNKRRQDLPESYKLNGAIYIIKSELIRPGLDLFCENSYAYVMEEKNSLDIDDEINFITAEVMIKNKLI